MFDDMPSGRPSTTPRAPFGERLAAARQRAGLAQAELGEKLGLSQRAIAHWERRNSSLYPEQIVKLCRVLDVSPEELLGIEGSPRKSGRPSQLQRQIAEIDQLPASDRKTIVQVIQAMLDRNKTST